jgi:anaerobic ribonucleoside-triphosphate reductase activating protein
VELLVDLGRFDPCVRTAIGPGCRVGIWVRGCSFRCPGCCTPEFRKSGDEDDRVSVVEIIRLICEAYGEHEIEGVTLSGGEPFEQAIPLAVVAAAAQYLGLSVQIWTGYTIEELRADNAPVGAARLMSFCDVLIDGRYERHLPTAPMRGSSNQRLHFLTDRYSAADYKRQSVELRFGADGTVESFGILPPAEFEAAAALLGVTLKRTPHRKV